MTFALSFQDDLDHMPDNFLNRLNNRAWTSFHIRSLLMSCLLVFGGGHRSDVIKNMTMEEWRDRRIQESIKGEKVRTMKCMGWSILTTT